jgi:phospholipid-binding lipoprotein MlaA
MMGKRFHIIVILITIGCYHGVGCSRIPSLQEKTAIDVVTMKEKDRVQVQSTERLDSLSPNIRSEDAEDALEDAFEDELEDEFAEEDEIEIFDPLSGYNEAVTVINDRIYIWILQPVATGYGVVLPQFIRRSIARAFNNLLFPLRFINNMLQFKFEQAADETGRFILNTTVGILGFTDPAKDIFKLEPNPEDFGQTLGHYGIGGGFHIVLPLLGPSNLRDTLGKIPEVFLLDPKVFIEDSNTETQVRVIEIVNQTSLRLGQYESLRKDAVDLYPFLRDIYEQNRNEQIEE